MALLAMLVLLAEQLVGLHFHVQQSQVAVDAPAPAVSYAAHVGAHVGCPGDSCDTDRPAADFWTTPDQGWSGFALLVTALFLWLPIVGRRFRRITPAGNIPFERPVFLRPPSRAPPR